MGNPFNGQGEIELAAAIENLRKDIRMREESDRQMSTAWLLIYLAPIIIIVASVAYTYISMIEIFASIDPTAPYYNFSDGFTAEFVRAWIVIGLTGLINFAVAIVLIYMLVNRRYTHFKRQKFLLEDIIAAIGSLAKTKDIDIGASLSPIERTVREANAEETEKSAILWAILSAFVPFAQFYVYYFLMKDFYRHERREDGFWEDASSALNRLSVNFSVPRRTETMPDRSFVLYLILSVITVGLFGIYWVYVMLKDPNEHFKYHIHAESQLMSTLEPALS